MTLRMNIANGVETKEARSVLQQDDPRAVHWRSILATMPAAMVMMDDRGNITAFSRAAGQMFGFSESEMIGENISILMAPSDREQHDGYIDQHTEMEAIRNIGMGRMTTARRRDGSTFPVELTIGEAATPNGPVFTGFIRDLTESRRAERRLRDLQSRLAHVSHASAIATLAAALAHELNQPLTAITNYVETVRDLLQGEQEGNGALRAALDEAAAQSIRAGRIVRGLRDCVARKKAEKLSESLNSLITEAKTLAFTGLESTVEVRIKLDPSADNILADRAQVQQVILNLIRNALEAMERSPIKTLQIQSAASSGHMIEVAISDSGEGLRPETVNTLFEPFQSSKEKGLGLGLAICRTIVESHGGQIWAEPSPLGGTAFHFTLARASADTNA